MAFYPYAFLEFQPLWLYYSALLSHRASFQVAMDPDYEPDMGYGSYPMGVGIGGALEAKLSIVVLRLSLDADLGPYRYDNYGISGDNFTTYTAVFSFPLTLQAGLSVKGARLLAGPTFAYLLMLDGIDAPNYTKNYLGTSFGGGFELRLEVANPFSVLRSALKWVSNRSAVVGVYIKYLYFPTVSGTLRYRHWTKENVYPDLDFAIMKVGNTSVAVFSSAYDPVPFKVFSAGIFASF